LKCTIHGLALFTKRRHGWVSVSLRSGSKPVAEQSSE
jgi:hypothetical protein